MKPWFAQYLLILLALLLLTGCEQPSQTPAMGQLMGRGASDYAQVLPNQALHFPADHLAHRQFRQEWWYLTANLTTDSGEPLGLQWTQFRIALNSQAPTNSSPWASNQLWMTHAALTFSDSHQTAERWSRDIHANNAPAGVSGMPLSVWNDNWRWQASNNGADTANPNYGLLPARLQVTDAELAYELQLSSQAPLVLQGDNGYSRKSADGKVASYYYSQPFIHVSGKVRRDGQWLNVSGDAWLDREWSSEFLTRQQQGWDWFAIRLADGSALMLFQLRATEGQAPFYSGKRIWPDGHEQRIAAEQIQLKVSKWHKLADKRYPVAWQIDLPSEQLELQVEALNNDARMPLSVSYWEGPIRVTGSQQGSGYLELTGY
ncbi:carotenoid 1,2-hydratase [Shewanella sp. C32]|uniref:Carotenoid 1,2-hydratase n=1 Tax=Shewanella electrica TaxID=515560 RepID=A0ABT2FF54_9GAMM|nr:lipocalin-like domain-containing protein [Shewanella electrica]MCH1924992.1 carotenoid 1,2-hydratase [Shewanella electrica]MCS4554816.1 carotenoid 1,2-hydratase [Shewanella electrica]